MRTQAPTPSALPLYKYTAVVATSFFLSHAYRLDETETNDKETAEVHRNTRHSYGRHVEATVALSAQLKSATSPMQVFTPFANTSYTHLRCTKAAIQGGHAMREYAWRFR